MVNKNENVKCIDEKPPMFNPPEHSPPGRGEGHGARHVGIDRLQSQTKVSLRRMQTQSKGPPKQDRDTPNNGRGRFDMISFGVRSIFGGPSPHKLQLPQPPLPKRWGLGRGGGRGR